MRRSRLAATGAALALLTGLVACAAPSAVPAGPAQQVDQVIADPALATAPLLQELQLGANPLTDLTPLLGIGSLMNLGLDETDSSRLTGIEELRAAGVSVNGLA